MNKKKAKKKPKKPRGYGNFDNLTRKLIEVPKNELDQQTRKYNEDKKKKQA